MERERAEQLRFEWGQREPAPTVKVPERPVQVPMLPDGTAVRVLWADRSGERWLDGTVRGASPTVAQAKLANGRIAVIKADGTGLYQTKQWTRA